MANLRPTRGPRTLCNCQGAVLPTARNDSLGIVPCANLAERHSWKHSCDAGLPRFTADDLEVGEIA